MKQAEEKSENSAPILIKKYANRRLYHTQRSEYVTLDDLAQMTKDGVNYVVQDAKSGDDITRSVLTQIIFDAENNGQMLLPTGFLREIIRLYGDSMQGMVPSYLEMSMQNFLQNQEEFRKNFEASSHFMGWEQVAKFNQDWMQNSLKMFENFGGLSPMNKSHDEKTLQSNELDELKSQLQTMQDKLNKLID